MSRKYLQNAKKSQQNTIFLALIIALRKYYRKNKRKYLRIAK